MADAVFEGATDEDIQDVEVCIQQALDTTAEDLLSADGLILGTPENFGYMSGGLKDFFDRTRLLKKSATVRIFHYLPQNTCILHQNQLTCSSVIKNWQKI